MKMISAPLRPFAGLRVVSALASLALASCGTTLTLEKPVPAIIDVNRNSTLAVISHSYTGDDIAREVRIQLHPSDYYQIQPYRSSPGPDTDVLVSLDDADFDCRINYNDSDDHHDRDEDRKHRHDHDRNISSYSVSGSVRCRFSSRTTGSTASRSYYASDTSSYSERDAHSDVIGQLAEKIVRDIVPHHSTYSVTIDTDDDHPVLKQAAEACRQGNWAFGKQIAQKAADADPQLPEPWFLLGIIARHDGDYSRSNSLLSKAAALGQDSKYNDEIRRNAELQYNRRVLENQLQSL